MTALGWLGLALAALLLPVPRPALERARALRAAGRLAPVEDSAATGAQRHARWGRRARDDDPVPLPPLPPLLLAAAAAGIAAGLAGGVALGVAGLAAAWCAAVLVRAAVRRRRAARARAELLAAVRLMCGEVEAGQPWPAVLQAAASAGAVHAAAFGRAASAAARGGPVDEALGRSGPLTPIVRVWRVAADSGAPVAGLLNRLGDDLAARARLAGELRVALAAPRSTALLLAALPAVGLVLGAAGGTHTLGWLVSDPVGRAVCCAGVLLDVAGMLWTAALLHRAEGDAR